MKLDSSVFLAPGAVVLGEVTVGRDSSIWYNAVVRGDEGPITVGERTNVQDCAVLHCGDGFPLIVGSRVTIGHGAVVHGCTVEDGALIGMGAIVLNGARIGAGAVVAAGALVPEGMEVPAGTVVMGSPAKVRRKVRDEEKGSLDGMAAEYVALARNARDM